MNFLGPKIQSPEWIDGACRYYSEIERDRKDSVRMMRPPDEGDASNMNPGTLCMRLAPGFREVRVLDAAGNDEGVIRPRGLGFGYSMRRSGCSVWTVANRSAVIRRHVLEFFRGGTWGVRTPFFWWVNIVFRESSKKHAMGHG